MRSYAARAMIDFGRVMARAGGDPSEVLQGARRILVECDAQVFLFEVDAVLAELRRASGL